MKNGQEIQAKLKYVKIQTLKLHKIEPIVRVASSLSCIELLTTLYYGGFIRFNPKNPLDETRDRFIISKGHGSICLYPILADLGFFDTKELEKIGQNGSFLGTIPEPTIPGYETINGSLGHGLGTACGLSLGLKKQGKTQNVLCLMGDGELNEGSVWEGIMFAAQHKLDNLSIILDKNGASMLGFTKDIIDLDPLAQKFKAFNFDVFEIKDGHSPSEIYDVFKKVLPLRGAKPKIIIANTIKGKGVEFLEKDPLCHILSIKSDEIDELIKRIEND
ncbi:transketolase [Campylobacter troglodytis]|uniref:transketolase n=1 Tax=Campylobacter troglodytis TaxID=654363 RepID=UPI001C8ED953|nr:transketolase [Campylobacter troglodytis]